MRACSHDALVAACTAEDQQAGEQVELRSTEPEAETPLAAIDTDAFRRDWLAMQDTHDFFPLLRRHKVSRRQAMQLAPDGHAERLDNALSRPLLEQAGATEDDLKAIDAEIKAIVAEAVQFAQESPEPDPSELYTDVYVEASA